MWSPEDIRSLFAEVRKAATADEVEMQLEGGEDSLTRFANNIVHQNVSQRSFSLSVRTAFGKKTGRASTNRLDRESVRRCVETSEALAKLTPDFPDLLPVPEPPKYIERHHLDEATAAATPEARAAAVKEVLQQAEKNKLVAAGYFSTGGNLTALGNSKGLFGLYRASTTGFSATFQAPDFTSWVNGSAWRLGDLDLPAMTARGISRALLGRGPRTLDPGKYTVVLEPAAVADLMIFIQFGYGGRGVLERQSFLTDRVGKQVFGKNIDLEDNVFHPLHSGPFFDSEGVPRQKVTLAEKGVAKNLVYDRATALKMDAKPTGHGFSVPNTMGAAPMNLVLAGGSQTVEDLVAATPKGVLVTRFWYNRLVEPMQVVLTGQTRDGTFLIENGRVSCGIRNFRYNQSVVEMLNRVTHLGRTERASGVEAPPMVVPAVRVEDFNFAGVTAS